MRAMVMAGAMAVVMSAVAAANAAAPPDPLAVLSAVDSLTARARKAWPGFDPASVPLAIGSDQTTWLYHHPAPPMDFTESKTRPGLWTHPGLHDSIRANSSAMIEGVRTATILLTAPVSTGTARDIAGTAIHEMFHVFVAGRHPEWNANEFDRLLYPVGDTTLLAARRLETEALRRALAAPAGTKGAGEAGGWAAEASAQHHRAESALPAPVVRYANLLEIKEGLADYVRVKAVNATPVTSSLLSSDDFPPEAVRDRAHAVGLAWGLLLDRLDPGWVARFDSTRSATSLAAFADSLPALRGVAPREFGPDDIARADEAAARAASEIAARMTSARAAFFARPGWRIVFVTDSTEPFYVNRIDPMNMSPVSATEVLHQRWLQVSNRTLALEALDVPALTEGIEGQPLMAGIRQVVITGLAEKPTISAGEKGATIRGTGFEAHAPSGRYVVEENGNEMKILVTKSPPRPNLRTRRG